jgi:hypothetical protein
MSHGVDKTPVRHLILKYARSLAVLIVLCGGSMLFAAPSAWAFGCQGHEIIAMIAEKHLSPHAAAMVQQLLKDNPIDPALTRYCKQPNLDLMAYSSTWADDYRSAHYKETASWHQIDIPISISTGNLADYCPPSEGCVTQALKDQIAFLRSPDTHPQKRADALRFVIHFVGDLHQPLHTSDNNDLGGNCIPVTFFGEAPKLTNPERENYAPNLHALWDYGIYQREFSDKSMPPTSAEYKSGYKNRTMQESAAELDRQFASQEAKWMRGPVDVDPWTWESFQIAKKIVYGKLPVAVPAEKPAGNHSCVEDDHISTRMLKLNEKLDQPYQDAALPVFEEQVAKAGARLALILNQIWP